ncbi:MAG: hypothetical protein AB7O98_15350, partial [Hyphomonadaceae bacterium]
MRLAVLTTASLCLLAGQAAAERYNATSIDIIHTAAVVTVIPEDRTDIDVSVTPAARLPALDVRLTSEGEVIDGGLRNRFRGCKT